MGVLVETFLFECSINNLFVYIKNHCIGLDEQCKEDVCLKRKYCHCISVCINRHSFQTPIHFDSKFLSLHKNDTRDVLILLIQEEKN